MTKRLIWTIWTLMSSVLKKADKLNLYLSFIHVVCMAPSLSAINLCDPHSARRTRSLRHPAINCTSHLAITHPFFIYVVCMAPSLSAFNVCDPTSASHTRSLRRPAINCTSHWPITPLFFIYVVCLPPSLSVINV